MVLEIDPDDIVRIIPANCGWSQRDPEGSAPVIAWALTRSGNVVPITTADVIQPGCRECTLENDA